MYNRFNKKNVEFLLFNFCIFYLYIVVVYLEMYIFILKFLIKLYVNFKLICFLEEILNCGILLYFIIKICVFFDFSVVYMWFYN